jgi:integrase
MGKKKTFSVVELSQGKFYVVTYENRKRVILQPNPKSKVKYLTTQAAAERARDKLQRNADATAYRELNPIQRREYWELVAMAKAHGLDLREAVEKGCGRSTSWPERIHHHIPRFLDYCRDDRQLRRSSINFYKDKFAVLFRDYPRATFGDFPAHRLKEAIKAHANGHEWEKGAVRAISALWNWGSKQHPPISPYGITRAISLDHPKRDRAIDFLTVAEAARALHYASSTWARSAIALMAFCGLRKTEAEQLRWDWIDFSERTVHIPEHVSKTPGGRLIDTAPPVLWQWLQPAPGSAKYVCRSKLRHQIQRCARASGIPRWPQSALRHTFITYHYAAYKDRAATIAISGHDGDATTLEQKYRGVAARRGDTVYLPTRARGLKFLRLTPDKAALIARASSARIEQL